MGPEQVLNIGTKAITQIAKKTYVEPTYKLRTLEESLGLKMENLCEDVVQIERKNVTASRFSTPQMKQAREMNRIASQEAKAGAVYTYHKASVEDLKRLTSTNIEDCYSRVTWTNPKDGKIYHLLKQNETPEGKIVIRILDQQGAFLKEAEVIPKDIAIIDEFYVNPYLFSITHGERVKIFAQRHNPFAKYTLINAKENCLDILFWDKKLLNALLEIKDKRFDYISISSACHSHGRNICTEEGIIIELNNQIHKKGTRVLMGSGNNGKTGINLWLSGQIEGVGSLSRKGKVSEFSASRNSRLTQHYEVGEYSEQFVYDDKGNIIGLNITGKPGCDYKFNFRVRSCEEINKLQLLRKREQQLEAQIKALDSRMSKMMNEIIAQGQSIDSEYWSKNETLYKLIKELEDVCSEIKYISNETIYYLPEKNLIGTSFSTPIRTAKLALNDMMEGVL